MRTRFFALKVLAKKVFQCPRSSARKLCQKIRPNFEWAVCIFLLTWFPILQCNRLAWHVARLGCVRSHDCVVCCGVFKLQLQADAHAVVTSLLAQSLSNMFAIGKSGRQCMPTNSCFNRTFFLTILVVLQDNQSQLCSAV